jgi:hypothetical protein
LITTVKEEEIKVDHQGDGKINSCSWEIGTLQNASPDHDEKHPKTSPNLCE